MWIKKHQDKCYISRTGNVQAKIYDHGHTDEFGCLFRVADMVRGSEPALWRKECWEIVGLSIGGDTHTLRLLSR